MKTILMSEDDLKALMQTVFLSTLKEFHQNARQPEPPDLISIEDAMKITHLQRQTLYGLKFEKRLVEGTHYFKRGKKLLFSRKGLLNWLTQKDK